MSMSAAVAGSNDTSVNSIAQELVSVGSKIEISLEPAFHIATCEAQQHKSPAAAAQSRHDVYLSQAAALAVF